MKKPYQHLRLARRCLNFGAVFFFFLLFSPHLWGQIHQKHSAFFSAGYNFRGYVANLGYSLNLSYFHDDEWSLNLEAQVSREGFTVHEDRRVPVNTYLAMLSINHGVNELFRETRLYRWKTRVGLGLLYGAERINGVKGIVARKMRIIDRSKGIYGVFPNISIFIPILPRYRDLYLRLNYKPFYVFNSDLGSFINNVGLGLMFSL